MNIREGQIKHLNAKITIVDNLPPILYDTVVTITMEHNYMNDVEYSCFVDLTVTVCYQSPYSLGFPCGSAAKKSTCNAGDLGSIPGLGRSPEEGYLFQYSGLENSVDCTPWGGKELDMTQCLSGEGNGNPLQYSCLENPMDGGAWQAAVHGVAKSQT